MSIQSITQDKDGFIWFGTSDGLNRYDGYDFKVFRKNLNIEHSLSDNDIVDLAVSSNNQIWIATRNGEINRYDPISNRFTLYRSQHSYNPVNKLFISKQDDILLATNTGIEKFDPISKTFKSIVDNKKSGTADIEPNKYLDKLSRFNILSLLEIGSDQFLVGTQLNGLWLVNLKLPATSQSQLFSQSLANKQITSLSKDAKNIWIGTDKGLYQVNGEQLHTTEIITIKDDISVKTLFRDTKNKLWIGTNKGLLLNNISLNSMSIYHYDSSDSNSLSYDDIRSIYSDSEGNIWIGTFGGGLSTYYPSKSQFSHFKKISNDPNSLNHNLVTSFQKLKNGELWIGTDGGGINIYDNETRNFRALKNSEQNPNSLSNNRVLTLKETRTGDVWVGTWGGGLNHYDFESKKFQTYRHEIENSNSLSNDAVISITESKSENLWLGTWGGGLNQFNPNTKQFTHYKHDPNDENSISFDTVWTVFEDSSGTIWAGTYGGGLNRLQSNSIKFDRFTSSSNGNRKLSSDFVLSLHESKDGYLWVGTGSGLNKLDLKTLEITTYDESNGLPNNTVYGILEDNNNQLWLSSNKGLIQFNPESETFKHFLEEDGLQANEFNANAFHRARDGELFFGGINGFNRFYPSKLYEDKNAPNVVLTELLVFNKPVMISNQEDINTPKIFRINTALNALDSLTISHKENLIAFEFSGIHFTNPKNTYYDYQLVGFDQSWIRTLSNNRRATYTNLPPGEYQLQIKAANSDGVWSEIKTLDLEVLPPPWKTWWAYTLYVLIVLSAFYWIYNTEKQKRIREQTINKRLKELNDLKDQFLANTSHELKTPLNAVIGLSDVLLIEEEVKDDPMTLESLKAINQCGNQLNSLVDDLLDFSKTQNHQLVLEKSNFNIVALAQDIINLLKPIAEEKSLPISLISEPNIFVHADAKRIRQVLVNLINNAIKFSDTGEITVRLRERNQKMEISIQDQGIGISSEKQASIFETFTQVDGSSTRNKGGVGLGLSICRNIIEAHESKLEVHSELGLGARFFFLLPLAEIQ